MYNRPAVFSRRRIALDTSRSSVRGPVGRRALVRFQSRMPRTAPPSFPWQSAVAEQAGLVAGRVVLRCSGIA